MEENTGLGAFLRAQRERLAPAEVGLQDGPRRRTPGLRRQEVAELAAVSVDWYIRLEQGRVGTPGAAVLDALARALRFTDAQRRHLHLIARGEAPATQHRPAPVSASLVAMLNGMPRLPAYLIDFRFDVLAHNAAAAALFGADFGMGLSANSARLLFLGAEPRRMQVDWHRIARETVGNLRANLARNPDDARLREVIDGLRRDSPEFAEWWADQTVCERTNGRKRIRHPVAGEFTVCYDALGTLDGTGQVLYTLTPAGPADAEALRTVLGGTLRVVARVRGDIAAAEKGVSVRSG